MKKKVKKGEVLQLAGEPNTVAYLVESGLLRSYALDAKGKEHTFVFAPEGWIVADNNPLGLQSQLFIHALEDSVVTILEKDMEANPPEVKGLVRRLAVLQERVIMLMSATALERYQHFIKTYPDIVQRVPQKMIASYLGITPEALSKVKRDLAHGLIS
jgi:CRP-like cAMP-binding protein